MDENKIRLSFSKQGLMKTFGAKLISVEDGKVIIECSLNEGLTQQHGFFHAGVLTGIVDSACGYAAFTLMPEGKEVLSVEFKINFLKPANTPKIIAIGNVLQSGKNLTVCEGSVYDATHTKLIAKMQATMIAVDV
ncbi:MAG: PaaI family thioesterase [Chitinophagaceae bacterium]